MVNARGAAGQAAARHRVGLDGRAVLSRPPARNAVQVLDPAKRFGRGLRADRRPPHIANLFRGRACGHRGRAGPGELTLFDPASYAVLRVDRRRPPAALVAASGDGSTPYVTNEGSDEVTDRRAGHRRHAQRAGWRAAQGRGPAGRGDDDGQQRRGRGCRSPTSPRAAAERDRGRPIGDLDQRRRRAARTELRRWRSGTDLLRPGASFSRRFDRAGTFDYACTAHPST